MSTEGQLLARTIAARVVPAYRSLGGLDFAYAQGSVAAGFTADSDLDLVLVWDREETPMLSDRPVHALHDGMSTPAQFHQPGFVLDQFWLGGQQVDVAHVTRGIFDGWLAAVMAGGGWERYAYPQPLAAVAGFAYGVLVSDDGGAGAAAQRQIAAFPQALVEHSRSTLAARSPGYADALAACVRRGDGWLFHTILADGLNTAFVAWFATRRRYLPFHKWIQRWIALFALDPPIAELERQLWLPGADLAHKHARFGDLVERVLALPPER